MQQAKYTEYHYEVIVETLGKLLPIYKGRQYTRAKQAMIDEIVYNQHDGYTIISQSAAHAEMRHTQYPPVSVRLYVRDLEETEGNW